MEDEQSLFKKANNKMLYMNLSSIALKKLREHASKEKVICKPPPSVVTKNSPTIRSVRKSSDTTTSPSTYSSAVVHEKTKAKTSETKPPGGTYYLDEIFKTSVSMEMHQKSNPQDYKKFSSDSISPSANDSPNKSSTSTRSFDSALQKVERKMMAKKNKLKQSSTLRKQQVSKITDSQSSNAISHSGNLPHKEVMDATGTPNSSVKTKPTSLHVQKLIDKGYAKVKSKNDNHVSVAHPTNRISLAVKNLSRSPTCSSSTGSPVKQITTCSSDKVKTVRQISISPKVSSTLSNVESSSSKVANSPVMSSSQFYGSQSQVATKNKTSIKPAPAPAPTKPRTVTLPNFSILKKKEVVLTGM